MRQLFAVAAAVVASALGALILGEYELKGTTPFVAGALFGLVVAELVLAVAKRPAAAATAAAIGAPAAGMVWAAYISSGEDWAYVPDVAWAGVALAPVAAALWLRSARRRHAAKDNAADGTKDDAGDDAATDSPH